MNTETNSSINSNVNAKAETINDHMSEDHMHKNADGQITLDPVEGTVLTIDQVRQIEKDNAQMTDTVEEIKTIDVSTFTSVTDMLEAIDIPASLQNPEDDVMVASSFLEALVRPSETSPASSVRTAYQIYQDGHLVSKCFDGNVFTHFDTLGKAALFVVEWATPKHFSTAESGLEVGKDYVFKFDEIGEDITIRIEEVLVGDEIKSFPRDVPSANETPVQEEPIQNPTYPLMNIKYRVFQDGQRLMNLYSDWHIDTFHSQEEANAFVLRWCYPGAAPEQVPVINMELGVDYALIQGDTSRVMTIKAMDLNQESLDDRMLGLQPLLSEQEEQGQVKVICAEDGRCAAVVREGSNGEILSIIWQSQPLVDIPESLKLILRTAQSCKKNSFSAWLITKDILALKNILPASLPLEKSLRWQKVLAKFQHDKIFSNNYDGEFDSLNEMAEYIKANTRTK